MRRGGAEHTLYIVLSGGTTDGVPAGGAGGWSTAFEVSNTDSGVMVATDDTRVLILSEHTLSNLWNDDPATMHDIAAALSSR